MTSAISNVVDRKMVQQNIPTNGFEPTACPSNHAPITTQLFGAHPNKRAFY